MLSSVLHVLAIIGIVLLGIIGFLLLLLLAVLFAPIRYRLFVEKEDGWKKENIRIKADIGWLAGVVRVKVRLFDPQILKVKFLFFTVFDFFQEKKVKRNKKKQKNKRNHKDKERQGDSSSTGETKEDSSLKEKEQETQNAEKSTKGEKVKECESSEASEAEEKKRTMSLRERLQKILYTIRTIYDKMKTAKETTDYYLQLIQSEELKSALGYVTGRLGKLLRHILPGRVKGYLLFGTGQPDQTGYILGLISIIRGMRGYDRFQIEADFERQIVEGKIQCKGQIRLATIGIIALQVYKNKELKELIQKFKREEN